MSESYACYVLFSKNRQKDQKVKGMYTFLVTSHVKLCTTSKSSQQEGHYHIQAPGS